MSRELFSKAQSALRAAHDALEQAGLGDLGIMAMGIASQVDALSPLCNPPAAAERDKVRGAVLAEARRQGYHVARTDADGMWLVAEPSGSVRRIASW